MFRKEALKEKDKVWESRVIMLPAIPAIFYVLFSSITFCLILGYIIFGSYTRSINVTGELVIIPYPIILESTKAGYIQNVLVTKGQKVNEGDSLFIITDNKFTEDSQNRDIYTTELNNIQSQIDHTNENLKTLDDQLANASSLLKQLRQIKDSYANLLQKKVITKQEYSDKLTSYQMRQQDYQNLTKEKEQTKIRLKELEGNLLDKKYSKSTVIKSPIQGIVASVDVTDKQIITQNRSLGSLKPIAKDIKLIFWLSNDAIPYVNKGNTVKIRYDAFPFEKFGQFEGIIESVSDIPASETSLYKNNANTPMDPKNPLYKVEVKIEKAFIENQGKTFDFFNGMQAETTFFLEKRKIYQWMLSPLYYLIK